MRKIHQIAPFIVISAWLAMHLSSCEAPAPGSGNITLQMDCAWENGTEFYGTMELDLHLSGMNMDMYGGEGDISGTARVAGMDGSALLEADVSGTWSNGMSGGDDDVELDIETADARLGLSASVIGARASDLDDRTFISGGMTLDGEAGHWHDSPPNAGIGLPGVADAWNVGESSWVFLDMALIDGDLFAAYFDQDTDAYSLIRITPTTNGQTTLVWYASPTFTEPRAIANDGTHTWMIGKEDAADTELSLFKFPGDVFSSNMPSYPVSHAGLSAVGALSCSGAALYFHDGDILMSGMGTIDPATGASAYLLQDDPMGSIPSMSRTEMIAVDSGGMHTAVFAPGDWWCEVRHIALPGGALPGGALQSSVWTPVNTTGPMVSDGTTLYVIQSPVNRLSGPGNRLYAIEL